MRNDNGLDQSHKTVVVRKAEYVLKLGPIGSDDRADAVSERKI